MGGEGAVNAPVLRVAIYTAGLHEGHGEVAQRVIVHELLAVLVAYIPGVVDDVAYFVLAVERVGAVAPEEDGAVCAVGGGDCHFAGVGDGDVL